MEVSTVLAWVQLAVIVGGAGAGFAVLRSGVAYGASAIERTTASLAVEIAKLSKIIERMDSRVAAVEIEQAEARGARQALHAEVA